MSTKVGDSASASSPYEVHPQYDIRDKSQLSRPSTAGDMGNEGKGGGGLLKSLPVVKISSPGTRWKER